MNIKNYLIAASAAAALFLSTSAQAGQCTNDTWNKVMSRGKVVVGVKEDFRPWGFRNADGKIVGMEVDIARLAAEKMGVELELVVVQPFNRMQFLEQGRIDLLIATMSDRPDRRKIVGIIQPNHYTSGTNILSPKALGFKNWEDLRGMDVCGKQGAFYNQIVTERYGINVITFADNDEARQALRDKKCVAWVYADASIRSDLASGNFDDFEMPLKSEDNNPWGISVPLAERDCIFGNFMSGLVFNMHQSGKLIELEKAWGIQASRYLVDKQTRYADWLAE